MTIVISLLALVVSFVNLYFSWIRVRGAEIDLLNKQEKQRAVILQYDNLPVAIQQKFPKYSAEYSGYAMARFIFSNLGDRPGLVKIKNIEVIDSSTTEEQKEKQIKLSYYNHVLIPATSLEQTDLILWNIEKIQAKKEIGLKITYEKYTKKNKDLKSETEHINILLLQQ